MRLPVWKTDTDYTPQRKYRQNIHGLTNSKSTQYTNTPKRLPLVHVHGGSSRSRGQDNRCAERPIFLGRSWRQPSVCVYQYTCTHDGDFHSTRPNRCPGQTGGKLLQRANGSRVIGPPVGPAPEEKSVAGWQQRRRSDSVPHSQDSPPVGSAPEETQLSGGDDGFTPSNR